MSDQEKSNDVVPMDKLVRCRRTGRDFDLGQHQKCPYCFGHADAIETGEHDKFCEFKPGVDPVCFGFPGNTDRHQRG